MSTRCHQHRSAEEVASLDELGFRLQAWDAGDVCVFFFFFGGGGCDEATDCTELIWLFAGGCGATQRLDAGQGRGGGASRRLSETEGLSRGSARKVVASSKMVHVCPGFQAR